MVLSDTSLCQNAQRIAVPLEIAAPLEIAVPLETTGAEALEHWAPLARYLEQKVTDWSFEIIALPVDDIPNAIAQGEVEFAVLPAAHVPEAIREGRASVIASAARPALDGSYCASSPGSILVLDTRSDLMDLRSLQGKRVIALGSKTLSGWLAPLGLIREAGLDPDQDLADLRFTNDPATVLDALKAGMIDAAILSNSDLVTTVRTGRARASDFRVLTPDGSSALDAGISRGSTEALPFEAFLRTNTASIQVATAVAVALFSMDPGQRIFTADGVWTAPASYGSVNRHLRLAGVAVHGDPSATTPSAPWEKWQSIIMGLMAIVSSLAAFRLYRVMRNKERIAKAKVENTEQDLKVTKQALTKASQVRASLLANFRQDFRTPLTAVLEISRLLRTTPLASAQVEYVNAIRETTHNLMGSIGNVTDFASLETGVLQIERRDFDLMAIIDGALLNVYEQMGEHHAELSVQVDVETPRALVGDPTRIRQVLQNLLHNAMKFTHSGDVLLHVSCPQEEATSATVSFTVIDTGVGMDKRLLKTAFEPYAMDTRSKDEGCGLGLPLSRMLVERMGGEMAAQSSPGKGTQISFSLSLRKQSHILALRDDDVRRMKNRQVLLIGGRDLSRRILQYYLHSWNAVVSYAPRFEDAVELMKQESARSRRFDLVLAPAFVAERNAVELVATIRDHPEFDGIPFVIIASRQECEALPQLEQLAGVLILPRPVRRGDLVIKLNDALRMEVPDRLWKDPSDYDAEEIHKLDFAFTDSNLRRGSVLVADSNTIHQRAVSMVLERMGYEVQGTTSGSEALQLLRRERFDLVLLDTRLGSLDGFTVASELRDLEQKSHRTPVVGMLPVAQEGERERCLISGMDDCILKPLDMETIARTLRRWTRKTHRPTASHDNGALRHEKLA